MSKKPECDCGTWKVYGKKCPLDAHSDWCKLLNPDKNPIKTEKESIQEFNDQLDFMDTLTSNNSGGGWGDL